MIIMNQSVSPVLVGKRNDTGGFSLSGNVLGTCFSVGGGFCLTAGHVVSELNARQPDTVALIGMTLLEKWNGAVVIESEVLEADIGVIRYELSDLNFQGLPNFAWNLENLDVLATVRAVGYPYGFHMVDEERLIVARAFKGEVVCTLPRYKPPGFNGSAFSIHELSFQAPRGLSGAPLLTGSGPPKVKGVVIGNHSMEMGDSSEEERLSLGIAVCAGGIASLSSSLLGRKVGEHLLDQALLK